MIDTVDFEDEAFSDFECFEEYELGADPLDVAMESALLEDEPEDEDPDLGDQSFEDFMDAWDFETPADDNDEEREEEDND